MDPPIETSNSLRKILRSTNSKHLYLIVLLCFLHSLNGFIYSCIPFIFYDPVLTCKNATTGETFPCTQNTACGVYSYEINKEESFFSITTEFELICDKRFLKPTVQSIILAGPMVSGLTLSFVKVNPYKRMKLMTISYILGAILAILSSLLGNVWLITGTIFICYLFSYVWYANIYTYTSEIFEPPLKKILPSLLTTSFGAGTMVFSMITLLVENWRYLIAFYYGVPILVFNALWILHTQKNDFPPKNIEIEQEGNNSTENKGFFDLFKEKTLKRNVLVYIFLWNMNSISYSGCDIALGSLSGKLAFTMFFLGAVQAICSFISGNLVLKYSEEAIVKLTTVFMAFFFLIYVFQPQNKLTVETYVAVLFTVFMIVANIGIELNWTVFVNLLQKYIPMEFQQNVFSFGDSCSNVFNLILPYYIEFMLSISLSPIFGFGILAIIGRIAITYLIRVETFEEKYNRKKSAGNSLEPIKNRSFKEETELGCDYKLMEEQKNRIL